MPSSDIARLNAKRADVSVVSGCVNASSNAGAGNFVNLVNGPPPGAIFNEYTCGGRPVVGFKPSDSVAATVPSAFIFCRVWNSRVDGVPAPSLSVNPG